MKKKVLISGLIIVFIVSSIIIFKYFSKNEKQEINDNNVTQVQNEPDFIKHGVLSFKRKVDKQNIVNIDIEIANDEYSREKGLMYRRNMKENQGMLFIFNDVSPRYFWMKNTYISLDIIYLDEKKEVVSIQKSAIPLSEESLPSYKDAMYVVEVIAGFTDKFNIKEGDVVDYETNK